MSEHSKTNVFVLLTVAVVALPLVFAVILPLIVTVLEWVWRVPMGVIDVIVSDGRPANEASRLGSNPEDVP